MKIHLEVDLTPEELRRLYGLPDLSNIHQSVTDSIKESLTTGDTTSLNKMIAPLINSGMSGFDSYQKMLGTLFSAANINKKDDDAK